MFTNFVFFHCFKDEYFDIMTWKFDREHFFAIFVTHN